MGLLRLHFHWFSFHIDIAICRIHEQFVERVEYFHMKYGSGEQNITMELKMAKSLVLFIGIVDFTWDFIVKVRCPRFK